MGEYANNKQDILDVMEEIKKGLGDVRFVVKISDNWINFVYPMALLEVDNNELVPSCRFLLLMMKWEELLGIFLKVSKCNIYQLDITAVCSVVVSWERV